MGKIFENSREKIAYAIWLLVTLVIIIVANTIFKHADIRVVLICGMIAISLSGAIIRYVVQSVIARWKENQQNLEGNGMEAVKNALAKTASTTGVLFVYFWFLAFILLKIGNAVGIIVIPPIILEGLVWWTIISLAACFIVSILWQNNKNTEAEKLARE